MNPSIRKVWQRNQSELLSVIVAATLVTSAAPAMLFGSPALGKDKADKAEKAEKSDRSTKAEKAPPVEEAPPPEDPEVTASKRLLKTLKTPFGAQQSQANDETSAADPLSSLSLSGSSAPPHRTSLAERLLQPTLYLPGHMTICRTAQFTIKGKPGNYVALAMADKDTGAKPIFGHKIRLGPDRKVVAAGKLPSSGVLTLTIETPIEGDLVGSCLYFEAAMWSQPDFTDMELAAVVAAESQSAKTNGVLIAAEPTEKKKGFRKAFDAVSPTNRQASVTTGLESGKP